MEERKGVNSLLLCFERPHNFGYWDQSLIDTFIGIVEMSTKGKTWPETLSLYIGGGRCLDFHIFIDETFVASVRHPPSWFSLFQLIAWNLLPKDREEIQRFFPRLSSELSFGWSWIISRWDWEGLRSANYRQTQLKLLANIHTDGDILRWINSSVCSSKFKSFEKQKFCIESPLCT